jgi:hypothetical protein
VLFFVRSALVALYPRTPELPGIADTDVDGFLRTFRSEATFLVWIGVLAGAFLFHATPLFTVFVPLPAFALPAGLRDKHADRLSQSSLYLVRQAVFLLKLPGGLCWGAHPSVRAKFALPALAPDPGTWRSS